MAEIIGDIMAGKKIERKILPPDPARIIKEILSIPANIEHVTPLPPLIERIHTEVEKLVEEKLPRLEQMGEFTKKEFGKYP